MVESASLRCLCWYPALVMEHCFHHLEGPVQRVTGWDTPYPHAFEWQYFPGPDRVRAALALVMES